MFYLIFRVTQGNISAYRTVKKMPVYAVYGWMNQMIIDNQEKPEVTPGVPMRAMEPLRNTAASQNLAPHE